MLEYIQINYQIWHVHLPDTAKIETKRAMGNLKVLAEITQLRTQYVVETIVSEVIYNLCKYVIIYMGIIIFIIYIHLQ